MCGPGNPWAGEYRHDFAYFARINEIIQMLRKYLDKNPNDSDKALIRHLIERDLSLTGAEIKTLTTALQQLKQDNCYQEKQKIFQKVLDRYS